MFHTNRSLSLLAVITAVAFGLFAFPPAASAQNPTGKIIGVVKDPGGAVIPGATVTATNVATQLSRQSVTDSEGNFEIPLVPIGNYRLTAENPGFKKLVSDEKNLQINQVLRVEMVLQVGAASEEVVVETKASAVETVNHTLGQSVTSRPLTDLPLNGRNAFQLALLQPGVTEATGPGLFSVAGGRGDSVTFLIDGGMNNNLLNNLPVFNPNPDSIAEFRILTSNYNSEYGRNAGGIVSVVTKSGTNQYHGGVFEFLRNDALNANSFFNNRDGLPREILKRNQFGFDLGGPITIPKLVNGKDRFFFYVNTEWQRLTAVQTTASLPTFTPAELAGDFSLSGTDPITRQKIPHPGVAAFLRRFAYFQPDASLAARAIMSPSRIDPVAQKYIAANLIPTDPTGTLKSQGSGVADFDELTMKFDFAATSNDKFTATLGRVIAPNVNPFPGTTYLPGYGAIGETNGYFANLSYTKVLSPRKLNEFRYTAQRRVGLQAVPFDKKPTPAELGIKVTPDNPTGPPRINWLQSGVQIGFSPQGPTRLTDNTFTFTDTFSWVQGKHSLKFGLTYSPYQNNTVYDFYVNGNYFFSGPAASGGIGSGYDFADFLLGLPDEYLQFPEAPSDIRTKSVYWFAQDEFKVSRRFTITLGLRHEYNQPKIDTRGRSFSLKLGQQSTVFTKAPKGVLFPGDGGAPLGANFADKNDFSPRFGFAIDPTGRGKTSIRGGFGVFYDILKAEDNLQFNGQAPFFGFADLYPDPLFSNPTRAPNLMSDPFGATGIPNSFPSKPPKSDLDFADAGFLPVGGGGVYYVDPNLRTPYVYQYNLSVQHELVRHLALEVSYVGNSSHKLTSLVDANPFILGRTPVSRLFNATPGNNTSSFSYLDEFRNVGTGIYNSLEVLVQKRLSETRFVGDTYWQIAYTYAHGIDTASGFRDRNSRVPFYNSSQFRASTDFDMRHRLVFSGAWDLPFYKWWGSGPRRLLHGWSLRPIFNWNTGFPLDVFAGLTRTPSSAGPSGAGDPNLVRVNLVGSAVTTFDDVQTPRSLNTRSGNFFFDPANFNRSGLAASCNACVTDPSLRTYGTLPRNFFNRPDRTNLNLGIVKVTELYGDNVKLEFRAEMFNAFNNVQWGAPNTTFTSTQFGQISTTFDPRIIQFGLKLKF
jgi:hypothetical protein